MNLPPVNNDRRTDRIDGFLIVWNRARATEANVQIDIGAGAIVIEDFDGRQWSVVASDPATMRFLDTLIEALQAAGSPGSPGRARPA